MLSGTNVRGFIRSIFEKLERILLDKKRLDLSACSTSTKKVLVLGIYLSDKKNFASEISQKLSNSKIHQVDQRWVCIGDQPTLKNYTVATVDKTPKFKILNMLLSDIEIENYDYLIITDDDIVLPDNFLDLYIDTVEKVDFSLSQPARSRFSELSHDITEVNKELMARQTNFVEIGPLFAIRRELYEKILPFDESSPMGWGYDFVWPYVVQQEQLKMGIIDTAYINHSIRKTAGFYSHKSSMEEMDVFLKNNKHVERKEAFTVLNRIWL